MQQRFRQLRQSMKESRETITHEPENRKRLQTKRSTKQARNEFLVIGLGRFGTSVANALVREGHDVLAIDVDLRRVQELSKELPNIVQIDATNLEALREIGADHFDTAVVCIGYDFESNLLTTVLLRKLGVRRVITKAGTTMQRDILLQVGADEVVLPEHEAGTRLAQRISTGNFVDYYQLGPDLGVVEMQAPARLFGQTLAESDIRRRFQLTVLAIRRNGDIQLNPSGEMMIEANDVLLVLGKIDDAERLSD